MDAYHCQAWGNAYPLLKAKVVRKVVDPYFACCFFRYVLFMKNPVNAMLTNMLTPDKNLLAHVHVCVPACVPSLQEMRFTSPPCMPNAVTYASRRSVSHQHGDCTVNYQHDTSPDGCANQQHFASPNNQCRSIPNYFL